MRSDFGNPCISRKNLPRDFLESAFHNFFPAPRKKRQSDMLPEGGRWNRRSPRVFAFN